MTRKKFLEHHLNSKVKRVKKNIYLWRDIYYQVLTYEEVKATSKVDHFVNIGIVGKENHLQSIYFRELSREMLKKLGIDKKQTV